MSWIDFGPTAYDSQTVFPVRLVDAVDGVSLLA
jgi:hypothetical protein